MPKNSTFGLRKVNGRKGPEKKRYSNENALSTYVWHLMETQILDPKSLIETFQRMTLAIVTNPDKNGFFD